MPEAQENLLDVLPGIAEARLRSFAEEVGEPSYRASQVA
jgi:hypothetical protein